MADYDVTYSFASQSGSDSGWDYWNTDTGDHNVAAENTDQYWCWTDSGSTSSNTGPPSGTDCIYTETSSPTAVGDVYTMTLTTAIDASTYGIYVTLDTCSQGDSAGHMYLEAFDGTDWNNVDDWAGDSTTTFTSRGPYNLSAYDNTDFKIRLRVVVGGTTYYNDFAVTNIRIYGDSKSVTPAITDAGDEDFVLGETNITVTGTDFKTPQGTGDLELGDSATYGSATLVSQSIDSWTDTSIQFDLTIGTLNQEQLWLYVTNSDSNVSNALEVHVEMTPTITDAGDEEFEPTETNIVMTGTNFLGTQSTGKVELVNNSVYASGTKVTQSIDSWADTSIQFDLTIGAFTEVDLWLFVTNSLGHVSAGYPVEILRTPTITDVEDENLAANEKGVEIDGTYFLDLKGTGKVEMSDNSSYGSGTLVTQVTNNWDDDLITFNVTLGTLSLGTNYLFVTNDQGKVSASYTVTIVEAIPETLYKTSSIQASITSVGLDTIIFLIRDE